MIVLLLLAGARAEDDTRLTEAPPSDPLEVHAWAEAGYMAAVRPEEPVERGAYLSLARLQVRLHEDGFAAFIQAGADRGELELLDARATWRPSEAVAVRAGRFKTPVSAEYLIPANHLIFAHRSSHLLLVPRRALGAEVEGHVGGRWDLGLHAGVYNPAGYAPVPGAGELLVGRALLESPVGLALHVAGSDWLHDGGAAEVLAEEAPETDRALDAALLFEEHGWTMVTEGVYARPLDGEDWVAGGVASVAHRFPTRVEEFEIEPAAAVEFVERQGAISQLTLNFHQSDWNLMQTVEWEVHSAPDGLQNAVYVQLQAGL